MIAQLGIAFFSCSAIWLVARKEQSWRLLGYLLGLMGQPFWVYATIDNHQWGMLAVSVWCTYAWCMGIRNHWN